MYQHKIDVTNSFWKKKNWISNLKFAPQKNRANKTTCEEATKCFDCNSELIGENNIVKQKEVETEKKNEMANYVPHCAYRNVIAIKAKKKWVYRHAKIIKQFIPANFDFNFLAFGLMHSQTAPIHNIMRSWPILMMVCVFKKRIPAKLIIRIWIQCSDKRESPKFNFQS